MVNYIEFPIHFFLYFCFHCEKKNSSIKIAVNCWSVMGAEHISEARYIHRIDEEITLYSGQYMSDLADLLHASHRYYLTDGEHRCYGYPTAKGLEFAMIYGRPKKLTG